MFREPDWAPSGTHYLLGTNRYYGLFDIVDVWPVEGVSRRLAEGNGEAGLAQPRWSPDGSRFLYISISRPGLSRLMMSQASGGRMAAVAQDADESGAACWSPDGQWVAYIRIKDGKPQLAKIKPGSAAGPVILQDAPAPLVSDYDFRKSTQWSPGGDWILYETAGGLSLVSPDGKSSRKLSSRIFTVFGFSKDGSEVLAMFLNLANKGQRELFSIDVKSGAEKMLAVVPLPASVSSMAGFSMHPDGKRFVTSIGHWQGDIWMLEGFEKQKTAVRWLLRH